MIRYYLYFVLLAIIWGGSFLLMRIAVPQAGPFFMIAGRVSFAALFLLPILLWQFSFKNILEHWQPLFWIGLLNSAIPFTLLGYTTLHLSTGLSSIINASAPLFTALVAWMWLNDQLKPIQILGLFIGFIGVVCLTWQPHANVHFHWLGFLAGVLASVFYGIAANYSKLHLQKIPPLVVATGGQFFASIVMIPMAIIFWPNQSLNIQAWGSILLLGVVCTAIAFLLFYQIILNLGAVKAVSVTYLIPVFAILLGWWVLSEKITVMSMIGGVVILIGSALTLSAANKKTKS